jgi:puromycin-sensitive aminopeptidase
MNYQVFLLTVAVILVSALMSKKIDLGDSSSSIANKMAASNETSSPFLPDNVIPSDYDVELSVDVDACTFFGAESIRIDIVGSPTREIVLHSLGLEFEASSVTVLGGADNALIARGKSVRFDEAEGRATVEFDTELVEQSAALLRFGRFEGKLTDEMAGLYRSKYMSVVDGEERWMAVTQFEATDARRAFPCWDEPARKSTFSLTVEAPESLTSVSNMPEKSRSKAGEGRVRIVYERTPRMSTYLVALVVGEFDAIRAKSKGGVDVAVYTPIGKGAQGEFALSVATQVLDYFADYFAIEYKLPKLDMLAIPDFAAGAMENWGCVMYRETALLIPDADSVASKQRVAYVVAHELAHQWFGNLVTMSWWKELWLNEGFATYAGVAAVAHIFPEWDMWASFISDYFVRAQGLDALRSSHPIEVEVSSAAQINEIFDAISYCKGASVIRMVATAIGEEAFRNGMRIYLARHQLGNAVTTDLWAALSESSKRDVAALMNNWTKFSGFPVVSAALADDGSSLAVAQRRFFADGSVPADDEAHRWSMLLCTDGTLLDGALVELGADADSASVPIAAGAGGADGWLKLNAGQSTFCRVNYDTELATRLAAALAAGSLPDATDRLGVLDDSFALARAGIGSTADALRLAAAYKSETDYTVATGLAEGIAAVCATWSNEGADVVDALRRFSRSVFAPVLERLTWTPQEGQSDRDALLRALAVSRLVSARDQDAIARCNALWADAVEKAGGADRYADIVDALPSNLRSIVYRVVVLTGADKGFEAILGVSQHARDHAEKVAALRALGASPDEALAKRALDMTFDGELVRAQDGFYIYAAVGANSAVPGLAWRYVKERWADIETRFGGATSFILGRFVQYSSSVLLGEESAADVERFFEEHKCEGVERSVRQSVESIRANTRWLNDHRDSVAAFLKEQ